eukprot:304273-Chlamydomonas_euryale.AAC.1
MQWQAGGREVRFRTAGSPDRHAAARARRLRRQGAREDRRHIAATAAATGVRPVGCGGGSGRRRDGARRRHERACSVGQHAAKAAQQPLL